MYLRTLGALLVAGGLLLAGCSAPSPATQDSPQPQTDTPTDTPGPGWYRADAPLSNTSSGVWTLHAAALGADSARAAMMAVRQARSSLASQLSTQLEQVRQQVASSEEGKDMGLGEPAFLLALRKAEREWETMASRSKVVASPSDQASSWRAFVELRLAKEDLTRHLGQALSSHKAAWEVLRGSDPYRAWGASGD